LLLAFAAKARPGHRFQARFRDRLSRRWSLNLNSSIRLRSRLYGFHTGTRSLWNRKGRGRRSAGREREPRRAGEGRLVWNRNFCVLIDYRLWAAKSEGRPWVDHCRLLWGDFCWHSSFNMTSEHRLLGLEDIWRVVIECKSCGAIRGLKPAKWKRPVCSYRPDFQTTLSLPFD